MGNRKIQLDFAIYLVFIFCITYIFISQLAKSHKLDLPSKINIPARDKDPLDEALAASSTTNKTVILAIVNKAYVEGDKPMLDLFLDGFWVGADTWELVDHVLIVAMDQISYERCKFMRLHCYKLETEGVDFGGEKLYMSEDFIKMMWKRTQFLGEVLKRGYTFIFTDIDVLWLRNPFPYLTSAEDEAHDLQISTDKFIVNQRPELRRINTGFYMVRSNNRTITLFDTWFANKLNSTGLKEQDVLQNLMRGGLFKMLDLRVKYLDTLYFSGFCQDSRDAAAVATVHANCCRSAAAKLTDLTAVLHDWKRYRDGPALGNLTTPFRWSYHRACRNSWRNITN